ncbi:MAG: hypothetical protein IJQ50_00305, partial [Clostridia bacterium]|nr:hypothetical protein [Clostridia bacterium]
FWDTENPPSLQSISMPNSVTIIGDKAFEYCSNLTDVYYGGSESDWSKISIGYDNEPLFNAKIHYNDNGTYVAFAQADNSQITVTINNQEVQFDQPPIIIDGRTLIPLRAIFEGLGANVAWREDVKTVVATRGAKTISLRIGENVLYLNTRAVTLDVPPQIINDRTLVPVRAISEALNCKVDWDDKSKTVKIESDISRVIEIEEYDKTDNKKTKWAFSYDDTDYEMIGYLNGIKIFKCSYDKEGKLVYEENESGEKVSQSEFIIWGGKDIYEAYNNATVLGNGNRVFFKDKGDNDWEKCIFDENGRLISVETYNSDLKSKSINTVRYNKNDEIERVDEEICDETSTLKVGFRKYEYDENGNITSIEASSGNRVTITYEKCKRYPGVLYNQTFGLRMNSLSVGY